MKITKYGHACLLVEEAGTRILIDPGNYSTGQETAENIDIVLITHEHQDHVDSQSLNAVLQNSPQAKVISNKSVAALLAREERKVETVEDGEKKIIGQVTIEGCGREHAVLHGSIPCIANTGYFINDFFYPGDAFVKPSRPVKVLALPVAAPWLKVLEAIDYALAVKPKIVIPVHDGMLRITGGNHRLPKQILEPAGIPFQVLELGKEYEL